MMLYQVNGKANKMIDRFLSLSPLIALGLFIVIDIICIGMGMGVPIFCILLGFPLGWYLVRYVTATTGVVHDVLKNVLVFATIAAGVTLLGMLIIWGPMSRLLFQPGNDLTTTGVPLILYTPRASFIGWLVLMILISPVLQLFTTIFSANLTLLGWLGKPKNMEKLRSSIKAEDD